MSTVQLRLPSYYDGRYVNNSERRKAKMLDAIGKKAIDFRTKVTSLIDNEESRGKFFEALRHYHRTHNVRRLVRDLKKVLDTDKKYGLFKEIRALIPEDQSRVFEKLVRLNKRGERLIVIKKRNNELLGFTFRGGKEHGIGFFVTSVHQGSPAAFAKLQVGDEIRKVNGFPLYESIHDEVLAIFKNHNVLNLVVKNRGCVPSKINNEIVWTEVGALNIAHKEIKEEVQDANNFDETAGSHNESDDIPSSSNGSDTSSSNKESSEILGNAGELGDVTNNQIELYGIDNQEGDNGLDRYLSLDVEDEQLGCSIGTGINENDGAFVVAVEDSSLAERAGLQVGDQLLNVNGKDFSNAGNDEAIADFIIAERNNEKKDEIKSIMVKEPRQEKSKKSASFGVSTILEYEPEIITDEEDAIDEDEIIVPNSSNFDYPSAFLEGREVHYIAIEKEHSLGMNLESIDNKIAIYSIVPNKPVASHGFLEPGDWLLSVEGYELIGLNLSQAYSIIQTVMQRWSKYVEFIIACPPHRISPALPTKKETSALRKDLKKKKRRDSLQMANDASKEAEDDSEIEPKTENEVLSFSDVLTLFSKKSIPTTQVQSVKQKKRKPESKKADREIANVNTALPSTSNFSDSTVKINANQSFINENTANSTSFEDNSIIDSNNESQNQGITSKKDTSDFESVVERKDSSISEYSKTLRSQQIDSNNEFRNQDITNDKDDGNVESVIQRKDSSISKLGGRTPLNQNEKLTINGETSGSMNIKDNSVIAHAEVSEFQSQIITSDSNDITYGSLMGRSNKLNVKSDSGVQIQNDELINDDKASNSISIKSNFMMNSNSILPQFKKFTNSEKADDFARLIARNDELNVDDERNSQHLDGKSITNEKPTDSIIIEGNSIISSKTVSSEFKNPIITGEKGVDSAGILMGKKNNSDVTKDSSAQMQSKSQFTNEKTENAIYIQDESVIALNTKLSEFKNQIIFGDKDGGSAEIGIELNEPPIVKQHETVQIQNGKTPINEKASDSGNSTKNSMMTLNAGYHELKSQVINNENHEDSTVRLVEKKNTLNAKLNIKAVVGFFGKDKKGKKGSLNEDRHLSKRDNNENLIMDSADKKGGKFSKTKFKLFGNKKDHEEIPSKYPAKSKEESSKDTKKKDKKKELNQCKDKSDVLVIEEEIIIPEVAEVANSVNHFLSETDEISNYDVGNSFVASLAREYDLYSEGSSGSLSDLRNRTQKKEEGFGKSLDSSDSLEMKASSAPYDRKQTMEINSTYSAEERLTLENEKSNIYEEILTVDMDKEVINIDTSKSDNGCGSFIEHSEVKGDEETETSPYSLHGSIAGSSSEVINNKPALVSEEFVTLSQVTPIKSKLNEIIASTVHEVRPSSQNSNEGNDLFGGIVEVYSLKDDPSVLNKTPQLKMDVDTATKKSTADIDITVLPKGSHTGKRLTNIVDRITGKKSASDIYDTEIFSNVYDSAKNNSNDNGYNADDNNNDNDNDNNDSIEATDLNTGDNALEISRNNVNMKFKRMDRSSPKVALDVNDCIIMKSSSDRNSFGTGTNLGEKIVGGRQSSIKSEGYQITLTSNESSDYHDLADSSHTMKAVKATVKHSSSDLYPSEITFNNDPVLNNDTGNSSILKEIKSLPKSDEQSTSSLNESSASMHSSSLQSHNITIPSVSATETLVTEIKDYSSNASNESTIPINRTAVDIKTNEGITEADGIVSNIKRKTISLDYKADISLKNNASEDLFDDTRKRVTNGINPTTKGKIADFKLKEIDKLKANDPEVSAVDTMIMGESSLHIHDAPSSSLTKSFTAVNNRSSKVYPNIDDVKVVLKEDQSDVYAKPSKIHNISVSSAVTLLTSVDGTNLSNSNSELTRNSGENVEKSDNTVLTLSNRKKESISNSSQHTMSVSNNMKENSSQEMEQLNDAAMDDIMVKRADTHQSKTTSRFMNINHNNVDSSESTSEDKENGINEKSKLSKTFSVLSEKPNQSGTEIIFEVSSAMLSREEGAGGDKANITSNEPIYSVIQKPRKPKRKSFQHENAPVLTNDFNKINISRDNQVSDNEIIVTGTQNHHHLNQNSNERVPVTESEGSTECIPKSEPSNKSNRDKILMKQSSVEVSVQQQMVEISLEASRFPQKLLGKWKDDRSDGRNGVHKLNNDSLFFSGENTRKNQCAVPCTNLDAAPVVEHSRDAVEVNGDKSLLKIGNKKVRSTNALSEGNLQNGPISLDSQPLKKVSELKSLFNTTVAPPMPSDVAASPMPLRRSRPCHELGAVTEISDASNAVNNIRHLVVGSKHVAPKGTNIQRTESNFESIYKTIDNKVPKTSHTLSHEEALEISQRMTKSDNNFNDAKHLDYSNVSRSSSGREVKSIIKSKKSSRKSVSFCNQVSVGIAYCSDEEEGDFELTTSSVRDDSHVDHSPPIASHDVPENDVKVQKGFLKKAIESLNKSSAIRMSSNDGVENVILEPDVGDAV